MLINTKLTLVSLDLREGKSKNTGEDYSIHTMKAVDEDYNVFNLHISKEIKENKEKMKFLDAISKEEHEVTLEVKPKGYDFSLTLTDF